MSGIGCSSKTPAYFVEQAHGFNGLHGRMPSAATGAKLANRDLLVLGISGDGDTASIGLGQYCHMIRRNVDCTYIVENNGCYGLTKGQFSATADVGSTQKGGKVNEYATIDICGLAIELGATFVARSFSGDGKQLVPLLQGGVLASGHGDSRRHQPVRHVQRSRGLDEELCVRERARRRAAHRGLYRGRPRDRGRLRTGHGPGRRARRRLARLASQARRRLRSDRRHRRAQDDSRVRASAASSSLGSFTWIRKRRIFASASI